MKEELLRQLVRADGAVDVAATYQAFCRETGGDDLQQFMLWLQKRQMLSPEGEKRVQQQGALAALAASSAADEATSTSAGAGAVGTDPGADRPVSIEVESLRLQPGQERYTILGRLGEGGMGQVLAARDVHLRRKVAIKTLRPELGHQARILGRFLCEAQITAQLDHPNVIPLYGLEVDAAGGIRYAMKLIQGRTLKELIDESADAMLRREPLDEEHALPARLEVFLRVCDALAYAHSKGVIHRDLKPPNIMIGRYREVYVMDWGIARLMDGREESAGEEAVELASGDGTRRSLELTRMGQAIGTPRFMSPEQAAGRNTELDGRSDQYALGLILFELVTLRRAVPGDDPLTTLKNALAGRRERIAHRVPGTPIARELRAIITKATALRREDRYPTVAALADDLRRHLRGEEVLAKRDNPLQRVVRWMGRHREWTLAALFLLALAAVGVYAWEEAQMKAAEERAFARERRIQDLLTAVATQAHRIDARFQDLEEGLEGLAVAAQWALTGGAPDPGPVYTSEDFRDPDRRPPDHGWCAVYPRWPVSLDWPVMHYRPGLDRAAQEERVRRLLPLRRQFRRLFLHSTALGRSAVSPVQERQVLGEKGTALDFAYVVLPEGVLYMYPGMGECQPDYDPLGAAYYTLSAGKVGKFWGNPYVDATDPEKGDELMLPCTTSIWDAEGRFLGVAGVELTFDRIIDQLLVLDGVPGLLERTLVDEKGRTLVDSQDKGKRFQAAHADIGIDLQPFRIDAVRDAIAERRSGVIAGDFLEEDTDGDGVPDRTVRGRPMLVAFYRLEVKGWYLVAEVDAREFLGGRAGK